MPRRPRGTALAWATCALACTLGGVVALHPAARPAGGARRDASVIEVVSPAPGALLVVIDALPLAVARDASLMPRLAALGAEGSLGVARTPFGFSVTGAAVYALLTGAGPGPLQVLQTVRSTRAGRDTIFDRAREAGLSTGVYGPAIWSDLAGDESIDDRHSTDEVLEDVADLARSDGTAVAALVARHPLPRLAVLHLFGSDHAGHRFRRHDPRYHQVIRGIDGMLARALEAAPGRAVVVVADHGMTPGGAHGGPEPITADAPLVVAGPGFRRGVEVRVRQTQLPSTLAAILGIEAPRDATDGPALELLDLGEGPPPAGLAPGGPPLSARPGAAGLAVLALAVAGLLASARGLARLCQVPPGPSGLAARLGPRAQVAAVAMALLAADPRTRPWAALPVALEVLAAVRALARPGPWPLLLAASWAAAVAWGGPPGLVAQGARGLQELDLPWGARALSATAFLCLAAAELAWRPPPGRRRWPLALAALAATLVLNAAQLAALAVWLAGARSGLRGRTAVPGPALWSLGMGLYFLLGGGCTLNRVEMAPPTEWLVVPGPLSMPILYTAGLTRYFLPWVLLSAAVGGRGLLSAVPPFLGATAALLAVDALGRPGEEWREGALQVVALLLSSWILLALPGALSLKAFPGACPGPPGPPAPGR
ncbi:MAG: alkaline phosphatase family protein [Planctomycetes bacterium]|nr:alkaline phosphatase family protein [Planctomycetota bacterium]